MTRSVVNNFVKCMQIFIFSCLFNNIFIQFEAQYYNFIQCKFHMFINIFLVVGVLSISYFIAYLLTSLMRKSTFTSVFSQLGAYVTSQVPQVLKPGTQPSADDRTIVDRSVVCQCALSLISMGQFQFQWDKGSWKRAQAWARTAWVQSLYI